MNPFRHTAVVTTTIMTVVSMAAPTSVSAAARGADTPQSFKEFRQSVLNDYSSFRENVLKDYARFLENAWVEYDRFKGIERDETPKPDEAPVAPEQTDDAPEQLPDPEVKAAQEEPSAPEPEPASEPEKPDEQTPDTSFDFYGMTFTLPQTEVRMPMRLRSAKEFANQWRALDSDRQATALASRLKALAAEHRLNDYLTFDLVRTYVNSHYSSHHSTARMALSHYLLTHMGFGARLGMTDTGEGLLLLPFSQTVYGRPYMRIDNNRFFIFADNDNLNPSTGITTCRLPDGAVTGRELDLRFTQTPSIPYKAHPFHFTFGDIELSGNVNANLFPMLYRYPQMEMTDYAATVLEPDLRADIVNQVKAQLSDKPQLEAVNSLLRFTQSAFDYATDEQAHGFEKPYFFEEMLFYPKCDCEDRAVFYTYLLWNALGVESHMINYPGHESAAVSLAEPIEGDSYNYGGQTYYISDPTYIGARTGQCMPDFVRVRPQIDHQFK